ncbi:allene oxide synthase-lipoxygenase protein-like [Amphiura filiformis]|uniref:allene oxide synthase-lipoxygenase protein-like n=1 Tax=Amphiura filiformis TaxID=82378 RepID=UPI003B22603B
MGNACFSDVKSAFPPDYTIYVKTGDRKGAGTSSSVFIALYNAAGTKSPEIKHECRCLDDFKAGTMKSFPVDNLTDFGNVVKIEIGIEKGNEWYVERIEIENAKSKERDIFPVHRWLNADKKMKLKIYDCMLPQDDEDADQRKAELEEKKKLYQFKSRHGMMPDIEECPRDEGFTLGYDHDIVKTKWTFLLERKLVGFASSKWKSLEDVRNVYTDTFPEPIGIKSWREDRSFGAQRLAGVNPTTLRLCTKIPETFPVTDEMLQDILGGMAINKAIEKKKLYMIDYGILKDLPCTESNKVMPSPMALFFVNEDKNLVPVAIQLLQEQASANPIYFPTDPEYTWLAAKMWFNVADAGWHQSAAHLGYTHLLMGSACIATHRCLSPSHPIFRLLAPHFLYLIAVNTKAVSILLDEGGWVDRSMLIGHVGMLEIIRRVWSTWRLDVQGNLPKDLEDRGVADPAVLPNYHYRDDAILLWVAIKKYVSAVVVGHYDRQEKLEKDYELQDWADTLTAAHTGCGIKGVPGDGTFDTCEQLIDTVTSLIFICSVQHAAVNFAQYDFYGFPPQSPAYLRGEPLKDKTPLKESDIIDMLANKDRIKIMMVMTRLLSKRGTNGLADYEVEYQFDPIGTKALKAFREDLKEIGATIESRNATRYTPYTYLHPSEVPNAISI